MFDKTDFIRNENSTSKDDVVIETSSIRISTQSISSPTSDTTAHIVKKRTDVPITNETILWIYIKNRSNRLSFTNYEKFIDLIMRGDKDLNVKEKLPFPGIDRYFLLKTATEIWLLGECGAQSSADDNDFKGFKSLLSNNQLPNDFDINVEGNRLEENLNTDKIYSMWSDYINKENTIPYLELLRDKIRGSSIDSRSYDNIYLTNKITKPLMIELFWSYWHEESMLVQAMKAISMRFQNRRISPTNDPLSNLTLDPLRSLSNLMWGYIQDEQHRLTVQRRMGAYIDQYNIPLIGKAVASINFSEIRSKFIEAFHTLLHICSEFYKSDDDTNIIADAFPVLNSLKEVHLILTQGAYNQYGDLPWTSRMEMLMEQWLLSRDEFRHFLPGKPMVVYPEPWMSHLETIKKLFGWGDTSILHFNNLAVFGEQILLSIRFHPWTIESDPNKAKNWARYWRAEIQNYIHSYRTVTGANLTREDGKIDTRPPSFLLLERLNDERQSMQLKAITSDKVAV